jgi:membrane protein implicated in regulation of membrane protease activity
MHVTIALAVGILAFGLLVLLAGLTPFLGIPLAVVFGLVPLVFFALAGRSATRGERLDKSGVPSSAQASYEPVIDPAERGP